MKDIHEKTYYIAEQKWINFKLVVQYFSFIHLVGRFSVLSPLKHWNWIIEVSTSLLKFKNQVRKNCNFFVSVIIFTNLFYKLITDLKTYIE